MSSLDLSKFIQGKCAGMCPRAELELRQRERLLHPLEIKKGSERHSPPLADPLKVVKEYSRSAAGNKAEQANELRPLPVLKRTTVYLINLALALEERPIESWAMVYDFVADRLRAVRKDMVMQGLGDQEVLPILEIMVLFHLYAGYRLCELKISQFDPKMNNDLLIDCVRRVLDLYDFGFQSRNQCLIESIFALHDISRTEGILRLLSLSPKSRSNFSKISIKTCVLFGIKNYTRLFRSFHEMPPPLACAMAQHLPSIRRSIFEVMSVAYSSKVFKVPADWLAQMVLLSSEDVLAEAKHYGIKQEDSSLHFTKGAFNAGAKLVPCTRLKSLDIELKMQVFLNEFLIENLSEPEK